MSFDSEEFANVAPIIVWGINLGYGAFLTLFSLFGLIFVTPLAAIGLVLGLAMVLVALLFLKPMKKEGWLYALILNILTIPAAIFILSDPVLMAFPITFAVLIVFIMVLPPIREPYK